MNAEAVRKVRDHLLSTHDEDFKMHSWFCGTAACIAGHTVLLNGCRRTVSCHSVLAKNNRTVSVEAQATRILGLSIDDANALFYSGAWPSSNLERVYAGASEREEAIKLLDSMLEIDPATNKPRGVWWS